MSYTVTCPECNGRESNVNKHNEDLSKRSAEVLGKIHEIKTGHETKVFGMDEEGDDDA
mgnify:CR=1 FL=1